MLRLFKASCGQVRHSEISGSTWRGRCKKGGKKSAAGARGTRRSLDECIPRPKSIGFQISFQRRGINRALLAERRLRWRSPSGAREIAEGVQIPHSVALESTTRPSYCHVRGDLVEKTHSLNDSAKVIPRQSLVIPAHHFHSTGSFWVSEAPTERQPRQRHYVVDDIGPNQMKLSGGSFGSSGVRHMRGCGYAAFHSGSLSQYIVKRKSLAHFTAAAP